MRVRDGMSSIVPSPGKKWVSRNRQEHEMLNERNKNIKDFDISAT